MKDVMIDLETVGRRAGCGILSIGAVFFDPEAGKLGPELYTVVPVTHAVTCVGYRERVKD